ncbi:MAG: pentapeptide repeat-containing protein [Candidatus Aminicenantes bacterium]|nr:pentapeptide repeat-containing protein [Candidatus Aminicenantes bacterium]
MANKDHIKILEQGVERWNRWREENPDIEPDLSKDLRPPTSPRLDLSGINFSGTDLSSTSLSGVNLSNADLRRANLTRIYLHGADLSSSKFENAVLKHANLEEANLTGANFKGAILSKANLFDAKLSGAILFGAKLEMTELSFADLSGADIREANLTMARLVKTNLDGADISDSSIYGISAWDLHVDNIKNQSNLLITPTDSPRITVDNLEVAQFIYLLLNNRKIRHVIDTITSKVVLILGRFSEKQKPILDDIREALRRYDYLPVLFDFEKPGNQSFIETVSTLAHMSKFVIADFTDSKLVLEEVSHIVRNHSVPVKPILLKGTGEEPLTLSNLRKNQKSVLNTYLV